MNEALWAGLAEAIAEDAESLAVLHDRELTPAAIGALRAAGFPRNLGLLPTTPAGAGAWELMQAAVAALPATPDATDLDLLAAEYAAVYLTGAYGASPCESAWTDDEHLICQDAMFEMRALLAAAGLAARDWRSRPDDHLVVQLLYIAHVARYARDDAAWRGLARMLDEHPLRWLPDFAGRLGARAESPFYACLAGLTSAWIEQLRQLIAERLGEPRPTREEIETRLARRSEPTPQPVRFLPGTGPGW